MLFKLALSILIIFCFSYVVGAADYSMNNGITTARYSDGSYKQYTRHGSGFIIKDYDARTGKTRYGTMSVYGTKKYGSPESERIFNRSITTYNDGGYEKVDAFGRGSVRITEKTSSGQMKYGTHSFNKPTPYVSGQQGKGSSGPISKYSSNYNKK